MAAINDIARKFMIDSQLVPNGIVDNFVLHAMAEIPREVFASDSCKKTAYADQELGVEEERFILSPLNFARLLQAAKLIHKDKVQDIGCANGYSSAVLAKICKKVVAVENSTKLIGNARISIEKLGLNNVVFSKNDLAKGCENEKHFDKIIINGLIEKIPETLVEQLTPGGTIVAVKVFDEHGLLPFVVSMTLDKKGVLLLKKHEQAIVSPLPEFAKKKAFVF